MPYENWWLWLSQGECHNLLYLAKPSVVKCQLIPSINSQSTLVWHLDWHSMDTSINTQMTLDQRLDRHMIDHRSSVDRLVCQLTLDGVSAKISRLSADCWPSDWVSTKVLMKYRSSVDRGSIDGRSRVLIEHIDQHSSLDAFSTLTLFWNFNYIKSTVKSSFND